MPVTLSDDLTNRTDQSEPRDLRMRETVHIADPRTGAVSMLKQGQPVPDWAHDLIPTELLEDAETAGALPASMTGGQMPPTDSR